MDHAKTLACVLMEIIGLSGFTTLLAFWEHPRVARDERGTPLPTQQETNTIQPWTGKDLMEMATTYDQQADELQAATVRIEQEVTTLTLRPHTHPKGFRRTSLMHVASVRGKAPKGLRELAVIPLAESERLVALKNKEGR